jgi:hypothetical protein
VILLANGDWGGIFDRFTVEEMMTELFRLADRLITFKLREDPHPGLIGG